MNSPAAIYKDLAIVQGNKAWIRAWNIRTRHAGLDVQPDAQPGDRDTRPGSGESWKIRATRTSGVSSRSTRRAASCSCPTRCQDPTTITVATQHGDNLYGTSVVAVDATTGKLRWYRQLVHHDIWDYDLGAAPTLVDVVKNGKTIPAVAQITKMGLLFVLDRTTGEPVWGIEERPVPQTTAPGEKTAPTQPFPRQARAARAQFDDEGGARDDHARARGVLQGPLGQVQARRTRCPTTPWNDKQDIVLFPGAVGGGNWNGVAVQPAARPDDHERHERRAVGASRAGDGTWPARR